MGFRFLEHTADALAECVAEDFGALLEAAAGALYALALRDTAQTGPPETRCVSLSGETLEDVLVLWLQELIYLLETESFVALVFDIETAAEGLQASARLEGYRCEEKDRAREVKSATYHQIQVVQAAGGYSARVLFDL